LDLGASYTQLPRRVIEAIGCRIPKKAKRIKVITAGGVKRAPLVPNQTTDRFELYGEKSRRALSRFAG
jgi:hypothetical protein